ncbi:alpha/beta hydrolase [Chloroflexota bacterium]
MTEIIKVIDVTAMKKVYGNYTQEELNSQYNQLVLVPNQSVYAMQNRAKSAEVRKKLKCMLNVSYGPTLDEVLDIFPAGLPGRPIQVYHHGGAWTQSHKDDYSYIAESFVAKRVNLIIPNFSLAPKVTLDEIVRQNRAVIVWAYHNAGSYGGDQQRLYICGHSSGGHLAGMMMATDWQKEYGLSGDLIKAATSISGMYELEPVRLSHRNEYLFLDERAANRNSPIRNIPGVRIPLVIGYGDGEHDEFKRQSDEFAVAWKNAGNSVSKIIMAGQNHFDVAREFARVDSPIMKATWANMSLE